MTVTDNNRLLYISRLRFNPLLKQFRKELSLFQKQRFIL